MLPCYHATMLPRSHGTTVTWYHGTTVPWCHGTTVPWYHGTTVPWYHGTTEPWYHGTMEPWYHGTMVPRCHGTMFNDSYGLRSGLTVERFTYGLTDRFNASPVKFLLVRKISHQLELPEQTCASSPDRRRALWHKLGDQMQAAAMIALLTFLLQLHAW